MHLRDAIKGVLEEAIQNDEISERLRHRWVPLSIWTEACCSIMATSTYKPYFDVEYKLSEGALRRCLATHTSWGPILEVFSPRINQTGIFKIAKGRNVYLYVTNPKEMTPKQPIMDPEFDASAMDHEMAKQEQCREESLDRFGHNGEDGPSLLAINDEKNAQEKVNDTSDPAAYKRPEEADSSMEICSCSNASPERIEDEVVLRKKEKKMMMAKDPYWESTEARKLFGARSTDNDVRMTLKRKIQRLKLANARSDGYKFVLQGGDPNNECTIQDISHVRRQSVILLTVYRVAFHQMGKNGQTYESCIKEVLNMLNDPTSPQKVSSWNRTFREQELWPHPSRLRQQEQQRRRQQRRQRKNNSLVEASKSELRLLAKVYCQKRNQIVIRK